MVWDMFFHQPPKEPNPYEFDMKSLKAGDTSTIMYTETSHFEPGLLAIHGIATDKADRICICGENGVEVYDRNGKKECGFTTQEAAGCIFTDLDGKIYLGMQDHIEVYASNGMQIKSWKPIGNNAIITSVAVSGNLVFVADAGERVVHVCDLQGNKIRKIGEKDPAKGIPGFVIPSPYFDLGIGSVGELWVVNPGRHHFEKYDTEGNMLSTWGISSMRMEGFCGCCNPSNFAMFPDGSFVTSEKAIERVKVYGPSGEFRFLVAGPESFIEGTKGLDLAVDSKGRILVLDPEKKQVRIFVLKTPSRSSP
jgi:hypothetical protein